MSRPERNQIRYFRKRASLTQEDVAFLLNYQHKTRVSKHETRRYGLTAEALFEYCWLFDCQPLDLLPESEQPLIRQIFINATTLMNAHRLLVSAHDLRRHQALRNIVTRCGNQLNNL